MNQQKGFSLLEVLVSLMLVVTAGLALVQMHGQTKQMLTQMLMRAKASHFLDHVDESLFVGIDKLPVATAPYHFVVKKDKESVILHLEWFQNMGSVIRRLNSIRTEQ